MKKILLSTITALFITVSASADHVDDGKCIDEIKHWNTVKSTGEANPAAKALRDEGTNAWAQGDKVTCEAKYKAALALLGE